MITTYKIRLGSTVKRRGATEIDSLSRAWWTGIQMGTAKCRLCTVTARTELYVKITNHRFQRNAPEALTIKIERGLTT
ncbi:hypothetical protein [Vibrio campbellii]|uniref:Uncharacterized protein n=1 Tax=Vibrio campbellii TaxID=680 RepID=A0ABY5I8G3_9VIBR|nr:hypothetical protein [Vibrio campbellii]UTZ22596.1 hypothetical protein HB760_12115 [Vibrio campbellii]UTZ29987.1 hypothetical protein HB762_00425 [Vibrio campbellii]